MTWSVPECLEALGVQGYYVMPQAVPAERVDRLRSDIAALAVGRAPIDAAGTPFLNRGHDMVYNVQREDIGYTRVFTGDPQVMSVLCALLNDRWYKQIPQDRPNFILRSLIARSSGPSILPLHIDSFIPSSGSLCHSCQLAVVLEDQTPERGCTVVVPGSHRSDGYADAAAMAEAIPLTSEAGDIVIWDSRLWHGALGNATGESRWSLIATFVRWWMKQNFDMTGTLPQGVYDAASADERTLFGYCSRPPRDEYERTDMKSGHADLKARVADYQPS